MSQNIIFNVWEKNDANFFAKKNIFFYFAQN